MEYFISQAEITRRKKAYIALASFLIIGTYSGSILYRQPISIYFYVLITFLLCLLGILAFRFFRQITPIKIRLDNDKFQRIIGQTVETYEYKHIKRVEIKWKTNHTIREIYIWMDNGKAVFLTALIDFEQFRQTFLKKLHHIPVKDKYELLDFDHPLFYPILGLLISHFSLIAFKSLATLNQQQLEISLYVFIFYLMTLGCYFCFSKPIAKRTKNTNPSVDYLLGGILILAGIILLFFQAFNDDLNISVLH